MADTEKDFTLSHNHDTAFDPEEPQGVGRDRGDGETAQDGRDMYRMGKDQQFRVRAVVVMRDATANVHYSEFFVFPL